MRESEGKIFIGFLIVVALVFLASLAGIPIRVSATSNQTNVSVQVAEVTQISVLPTVISWESINPGAIGGIKYIQVRNSGSKNITDIYAYADTLTSEPSNPYPAGSPSAFSSGSVLMLRKNETNALYYYADRLEWNISKPAGAGGTNCQDAIAWGYYRNVSNEYVWCLKNGTEITETGGCNSTNTKFYIEEDPDNGTADTRQPTLSGGTVTEKSDWGLFSFASGPLNGYCVAAARDCTKILIYEHDKRSPFGDCGASSYIRSAALTPGDEFTLNLDAWVPKGIPHGWLASSWLTLEGTGE
jgi:hypothetical protein